MTDKQLYFRILKLLQDRYEMYNEELVKLRSDPSSTKRVIARRISAAAKANEMIELKIKLREIMCEESGDEDERNS